MADGVYVPIQTVTVNDIGTNNVSPNADASLIGETFDALAIVVSDQLARIDTTLSAAENLLTDLGMPTNWTAGIDDIVILPVPPIDLTTFPELPLPGDLPNYDAIIWGTNDTTLSTYSSDIYVTILEKVLDGIENGGTGISTAVETAIHERNLERQRAANEKAYNLGISELSSRCLSFPQYAMQALANQVSMEINKQSHNSSNEIDIAMSDLAQKNMNSMLDRGVALEGVLRAFWKDYNTMKLTAVKAKTDELISHVESITKERDGILRLFEAEASIFKSTTEDQKNWYEAIAENQKAQLQKSTIELQKIEVELKAKLDVYIAVNSLREKILATSGGVSAQVAASAMNAENVSIGYTVQNGFTRAEHFNHGETKSISSDQSITEGHTYNAKGSDIT